MNLAFNAFMAGPSSFDAGAFQNLEVGVLVSL